MSRNTLAYCCNRELVCDHQCQSHSYTLHAPGSFATPLSSAIVTRTPAKRAIRDPHAKNIVADSHTTNKSSFIPRTAANPRDALSGQSISPRGFRRFVSRTADGLVKSLEEVTLPWASHGPNGSVVCEDQRERMQSCLFCGSWRLSSDGKW